MKLNQIRLLVGVSGLALAVSPFGMSAALAQAATPPTATADLAPVSEDIVVTGVRQSLSSAQAIKRNASQIVDSVQAQDIGKLPDANTVEALQRITGVQIQRRYGEGDTDFDHRTQPAITVRGLTQVSNFIDGRQALSAAGSRSLDLQAIPPELLAGIDVYKNPPADTIEGDVAGVVNIRTRLPFDQPGQLISATAKANYYDRAQKFGGSGSALYSNRFETGLGEMGFLLNASYGKSSYRQDAILIGAFGPIPAGITIPGAPAGAKVPFGEQIYDDGGDRKRLGLSGAFQWRAADNVLITAQALYSRYKFFRQGKYFYYNNNGNQVTTPLAGAAFTFDDNGYATSGSLANQVFESARFDQDLTEKNGNYTFNVKWDMASNLHSTFDVQYMKSSYNADRNGFVVSLYDKTNETPYTAPNQSIVDFDLRGSKPVWNVHNAGLLSDPNNYAFTYMADSLQRNDADQLALRYDLEYDMEGSFLNKEEGHALFVGPTLSARILPNAILRLQHARYDPGADSSGNIRKTWLTFSFTL